MNQNQALKLLEARQHRAHVAWFGLCRHRHRKGHHVKHLLHDGQEHSRLKGTQADGPRINKVEDVELADNVPLRPRVVGALKTQQAHEQPRLRLDVTLQSPNLLHFLAPDRELQTSAELAQHLQGGRSQCQRLDADPVRLSETIKLHLDKVNRVQLRAIRLLVLDKLQHRCQAPFHTTFEQITGPFNGSGRGFDPVHLTTNSVACR
mmetsp:Transcript_83731/g.194784  ORF Transcript_83731/g.194784 Transcript_83731/m.194784 type:complete len:206 (+) Transcript_83731:886-1503(+)